MRARDALRHERRGVSESGDIALHAARLLGVPVAVDATTRTHELAQIARRAGLLLGVAPVDVEAAAPPVEDVAAVPPPTVIGRVPVLKPAAEKVSVFEWIFGKKKR